MDSNTVSNLPFMGFIANENEYKRSIPVPPAADLLENGSFKQFMAFQRQHMIAMENSFKNIMDSNTKLAQSVQNLELTVQSLEQELKKTNKELEQIKKELRLTKSLSTLLLKKMGLMGKFQEFKDMGISDDEILRKMAELLDEIPNERQGEFEEGVHGAVPNSRKWSWKRILLAAGAVVLGVICPSLIPWLVAVV